MKECTLFDGQVCKNCGVWKPFDGYQKTSLGARGAAFLAKCKDCVNEAARAKYHSDEDAAREHCRNKRRRKLDSDPSAKERERATRRAYEERNKDKVREQSRDRQRRPVRLEWLKANRQKLNIQARANYAKRTVKYADTRKRWARDNPESCRARWIKHRAKKWGTGGSYSPDEWIALCDGYGNRCLRCGVAEPTIRLTIDHVIPLSRGGNSDISNLQPLCSRCNQSKGQRSVDFRPLWGK